jgi:plasmid stability protein
MATLTVRNLPDEVRDKLRVRAAQNGRSTEAEVRVALAELVAEEPPNGRSPRGKSLNGGDATAGPFPSPPQSDTQAEKLERARAILRRHVSPDRSIVDEFLRERRTMWGEE